MNHVTSRIVIPKGLLLIAVLWLASGNLAANEPPADEMHSGRDVAVQDMARVSGRLQLLSEDGERLSDRRDFANAVIYFEPDDSPTSEPPDVLVEMSTQRREFRPRVLPVMAGTEVRFPNEDPILHNVFSTSGNNQFDLGVYGESPGKTHRFDHPGLVRVFCNVHSRMSAHIVVVDGPHFTQPDSNGHFTLEDLPAGPGQLTVWHERAEPERTRITLEPGSDYNHDTELDLTVREATPPRQRMRRRGRY